MTRTGKIARLPQPVREELNRRRREAEPGAPLAETYGGGEAGRQAAALVLELRHDLELGTLTRKPEPGPAGSNPVKPSQTQSNLVKPSQTTFLGNQPVAGEVAGGGMRTGDEPD